MPDTPSTSPSRLWFRFLRLHQRAQTAISHRLRDIGLSVAQFDLLSTLTEAEGMTQRELADRLYVTKGNVSGLVDRLAEAGMLDRRAIPGDRRSHALHLTETGKRLAAAGMEIQREFVEHTFGQLGEPDLRHLDQVIGRLRDSVRMLEVQEATMLAEAGPAASRPERSPLSKA